MIQTKINDCKIIALDEYKNFSAKICVYENSKKTIPFEAKRVFYLYDIPSGQSRGAHAHKECMQLLISVSGSFNVFVDDGINSKTFFLNKPNTGLFIPEGIWASELDFSAGSVCLVLASHFFDEKDYLRDYNVFLKYKS
tara:strand:+ start:510 stop:926 length:417 start_codon:yes stop_codon:yes gene_type:complete